MDSGVHDFLINVALLILHCIVEVLGSFRGEEGAVGELLKQFGLLKTVILALHLLYLLCVFAFVLGSLDFNFILFVIIASLLGSLFTNFLTKLVLDFLLQVII